MARGAVPMDPRGSSPARGGEADDHLDDEQRRHDDAGAAKREEPFKAPALPRGQLVVRVDALELQARQLLERRASKEEQEKHAEKLQEARKELKASGGYTAHKLQFELLGEQKRLQKAHAALRNHEDDLQRKTEQAKQIADDIAALEQEMGRIRARIEHAEQRASYLALQVGTLGQHQQDVAAVHGTMAELVQLVSTGSEELRHKVESVAAYLRHIAPVFYPPEMDPVVADGVDAVSNQCSETDLDAEVFDDEGWMHDDGGGDDEEDSFGMPAHIDVVTMDLQRLRKQRQEAVEAARARGTVLLPETEAIFDEKLRVAEERVIAAEALNKAAEEVQDILQRRGHNPEEHQRAVDGPTSSRAPQPDPSQRDLSTATHHVHSQPGPSHGGARTGTVVQTTANPELEAALADGAVDIVGKVLEQAKVESERKRGDRTRPRSESTQRDERNDERGRRRGRARSSGGRDQTATRGSSVDARGHDRSGGRQRERSQRGRRTRASGQLAIEDINMAGMD